MWAMSMRSLAARLTARWLAVCLGAAASAGYRLSAVWRPWMWERGGDEWVGAEGGYDMYEFTVGVRWDWGGA